MFERNIEKCIINAVMVVPYDKQKDVIGTSHALARIHIFSHIQTLYYLINNDMNVSFDVIRKKVDYILYSFMEAVIIDVLKYVNSEEELQAFIKNDITNNYKACIYPFEDNTSINGVERFMECISDFVNDDNSQTIINYLNGIFSEIQQQLPVEVLRGRIITTRFIHGVLVIYGGINIFQYRYLEAIEDKVHKEEVAREESVE